MSDGRGEPDSEVDTAGLPNIPLLEDAVDHEPYDGKPTWRGWIHAGTFPLAIAAGIVLISLANGPAAKISSAVFMATSLLLFGISAVYHRFNWNPTTLAVFRRLDHSNIFLLIAGTYTPLAINALPFPKNAILLTVIWAGAVIGIAFRIFWLSAPRLLYVALYIILGWGAILYVGDLVRVDKCQRIAGWRGANTGSVEIGPGSPSIQRYTIYHIQR